MILIIGGTSGIGMETAKYLSKFNYNVLVAGRRLTKEKNIKYKYIDLSDENSIKTFFCNIKKIKGFIYSAGITTTKKHISDFNSNIFDDIININVKGLLLCLKYGYKNFKESQCKIVVVNSLASRTYSKFSGVEYTISKSALSGLVKQLSIEFAIDNILINSIYPGMTMTSMLLENTEKDFLNKVSQDIPLKRIATPLEIAKSIEFLISKNNTYITGSSIDINGGQFLNG